MQIFFAEVIHFQFREPLNRQFFRITTVSTLQALETGVNKVPVTSLLGKNIKLCRREGNIMAVGKNKM